MAKIHEAIPGAAFGRLTVLGRTSTNKALTACECGSIKLVKITNLGVSTKSCGCLHAANGERTVLHRVPPKDRKGNTPTARTYRSWFNIKNKPPHWYDFNVFLEDMGLRPRNHALLHIDKRKPYSKENCAWIPALDVPAHRQNVNYYTNNRKAVSEARLAKDLFVSASYLRAQAAAGILPTGWRKITYEEALSIRKKNESV